MASLITETPARALAIYAHPDDADVSCGGTLARWSRSGSEVHVLICTSGEKGTSDSTVDPVALAATRAEEVADAAAILGVTSHRILGHPDGELESAGDLRGQIVEVLRSIRPLAVVCPDPTAVFFGVDYYNHRDHRTVGWAALDAVAPAAAMPLYHPEAGAPHQVEVVYLSGTLEPDSWVDVTDTLEVKADALLCHRTQLSETSEWMRTAVRQRAEEGGRQAGVRHAEGFRTLRLA